MIQVTTSQIRVVFVTLVVYLSITLLFRRKGVNYVHNGSSTTSILIPQPVPFRNSRFQTDKQHESVLLRNLTPTVLIFNPPYWVSMEKTNNSLATLCKFSNCRLTSNRSNLQSHSAIIFYITAAPALPKKPPISPSNRNPNQVWIFAWLEAAVRHRKSSVWSIYQNKHWRNTVNWTMTYTYDADVLYSYGELHKRTPPVKNYSKIFHKKTKTAAWVVSNCHTQSQREKYVEKLQQHGIKIDVFGACAGKKPSYSDIRNIINSKYKFYLSFENSLCKDYITEKFFKYLKYDVVLVVRGGGNYSSLLPNDSYINTADFGSVKDLAKYLLSVGSSEKKYSKYLRNKDRFESIGNGVRDKSFCDICQKLNNLKQHRRIYTNLVEKVMKGTCFSPSDIT